MYFRDLINKTLKIIENNPWNEFNNVHNIILEHQDNFYIIEFSNNKCNIYPNVNNVYIYEHAKQNFKNVKNIYKLEQFSESLYNELEYYSFEYTYKVNMEEEVINKYYQENISLETNEKYISLLHKKINGKIKLLEEEKYDEFSLMLDLITEFLNYMDSKRNLISEDIIMFYNNNKIDLIKSQLFLVMLEQRIHYKIHEYKKTKPKIQRRRLLMDMRFLGPIEKEDFQVLIASYDDSVGKLLIPLGMKEINTKHILMYLESIFEKGIYKIIEVGNIELYHILKRMLKNFDCEIHITNELDIFDCIFEDYERIILNNSRIEIKK